MQAKEKHGEPQVIRDYKQFIYKLYHRPDLRPDQKIPKLEALANKFADGWPFQKTDELVGYGGEMGYRNVLEKLTRTLCDQIKRMEYVTNKRNVGRMDRTELDSDHVYGSKQKKPDTN